MREAENLASLAELAQLMLDHKLGTLKDTSDRLEQSRMQLSAINQRSQPIELDPIISSKVGFEYERWADARRSELNLVIARQMADWLESRSEAQTAFGRVQALENLAEKLGRRRP